MNRLALNVLIGAIAMTCAILANAGDSIDPLTQAIHAGNSDQWNTSQTPMKLYGNTYYVGVLGLSSVLIDTGAGLMLIDGDMPQSVALIEANIRKLGFKVGDIKFILSSHAHFDHAGGIAALQRDSGAVVLASPLTAQVLRTGQPAVDDPQYPELSIFPAVGTLREVQDGEVVQLGKTAVKAHHTPGHAPGGVSWTWQSCEGGTCLNVVYADSLHAVSVDSYHYTADANHGDLTAPLRKSIQTIAALPCDILISAHPDQSDLQHHLQVAKTKPHPNPFIDANACRTYAADAQAFLDSRVASERAAGAQ
jgi:metallo-beta-lactamase class B